MTQPVSLFQGLTLLFSSYLQTIFKILPIYSSVVIPKIHFIAQYWYGSPLIEWGWFGYIHRALNYTKHALMLIPTAPGKCGAAGFTHHGELSGTQEFSWRNQRVFFSTIAFAQGDLEPRLPKKSQNHYYYC